MATESPTLRSHRLSVVKVLTVSDPPDFDQPWQTLGATSSIGSGAIIQTPMGPRILTNAHVVEDHTFIEVRRYGQATKAVAQVEEVGAECDLALLSVEDPRLFRGVKPIRLGSLPRLGQEVSVLGFPIGGHRLSITKGVVSRIEMTTYAQSERNLLSVQIDAAINAGNSGGPVLLDGQLAGVAFQALEEAENIGYVIPAPVVEHFLRDTEQPPYQGFPDLGISVQPLESKAHRRALGLPRSQRGVLVTHVHYEGSCWGVLQPRDVLLAVDGVPVAPDGTVPFQTGARIELAHVAARHQVGDVIPLRIWRDGRRLTRRVTLTRHSPLVQARPAGNRPSYFLYAGLLFVPLSLAWLETWGDDWDGSAPASLVALYERGLRTSRAREAVVLQKVLADPVNRGYHEMESVRILRAQGRPVRSLAHLTRIVEKAKDEFVTFETSDKQQLVIDRAQAEKRSERLMRRYGVHADRSEDIGSARRRPSKSEEKGS